MRIARIVIADLKVYTEVVGSERVRQVGEEPVQAEMMGLTAFEAIQHQPGVVFQAQDGAAMGDRVGQAGVAGVFAAPGEGGRRWQHTALRPTAPGEAGEALHLILAVHGDGVVHGAAGQAVLPDTGTVIKIGARVDGDGLTLPGQVHVELVGVRWALAVGGAADYGPAGRAMQGVNAAIGERAILLVHRFQGSLQAVRTAQPEQVFVPGAGREQAHAARDEGAQLEDGAIVGVIAGIEGQHQRAVDGSVLGHLAGCGIDELGEVINRGGNGPAQVLGEGLLVQITQT